MFNLADVRQYEPTKEAQRRFGHRLRWVWAPDADAAADYVRHSRGLRVRPEDFVRTDVELPDMRLIRMVIASPL